MKALNPCALRFANSGKVVWLIIDSWQRTGVQSCHHIEPSVVNAESLWTNTTGLDQGVCGQLHVLLLLNEERLIVRCVGESKALPVIYSSYRPVCDGTVLYDGQQGEGGQTCFSGS